jgi:PQQ-dependent dehydrogenase (s-GDH family)
VLDDLPAHDDHGAGRLTVGPDDKLYVTRGDLGGNFLANYCNAIHSQDLPTAEAVGARDWSSYQGKVLRLKLDGSIPSDNPTIAGVRSHIYAFGFRNPQGLAFGPGALLYASDHGPSSDDEVDLITPGGNFGWPLVAGYKDDRGYVYANWSASAPTPCPDLTFDNLRPPASVPQAKETAWNDPRFVAPLATFFTVPSGYQFADLGNASVAPAGIDIYTARAIPTWANSVLLAAMRTGTMYRMKLGADGKAVAGSPIEYFKTTNRYRDVAISPDGGRIFLSTDSFGATSDADGQRTETLSHPGTVLEFTYTGPARASGR